MRDHVDAVIALIDSITEPVVLVGHSGGGAIAHGAVDARPDRVARVVYVDSGPLGDGGVINDEFPVVGNEIPLPDWSVFGEEDLVDLDDDLRASLRERAIPQPARLRRPQVLTDPRRYDVPVTVIACEFPSAMLREWMDKDTLTPQNSRIHSVELVDLPTGHWPQFTGPPNSPKPSCPPWSAEARA